MKRTWICQYLLNTSYSQIALIAIENGKLDGAWEQAIEDLIKKEFKDGPYKDEIRPILELADGSLRKAAKLILSSTIPT